LGLKKYSSRDTIPLNALQTARPNAPLIEEIKLKTRKKERKGYRKLNLTLSTKEAFRSKEK